MPQWLVYHASYWQAVRLDLASAYEQQVSAARSLVMLTGCFCTAGDLMRSMVLLSYKGGDKALELRARHFKTNWMTAVMPLDDDIFLGAENGCHLFTVRKNSEAAGDDDRKRLEVNLVLAVCFAPQDSGHHVQLSCRTVQFNTGQVAAQISGAYP